MGEKDAIDRSLDIATNIPTVVEVELLNERVEVRNGKLCVVTYVQTWRLNREKLNASMESEEQKSVMWI